MAVTSSEIVYKLSVNLYVCELSLKSIPFVSTVIDVTTGGFTGVLSSVFPVVSLSNAVVTSISSILYAGVLY